MLISRHRYFLLPETKDRTLEELDEMVSGHLILTSASLTIIQFAARIPARHFRTYVCKGREENVAQSETASTTSPTEEKEKSQQLEFAVPALEPVESA